MARGKVYLVGAGPGDPGLITVRGAELLRLADVVVFDRLASPELLDYAPDAERIDAGKEPQNHPVPQERINQILVEKAQAGKIVVRLKGGDPFVFGRGGEEALALAAAGVPFEVVPGISSSIGGPAYAGIPVTHRLVAGDFAVVTGHRAADGAAAPDWAALARIDTLVILMGMGSLPEIAAELLRNGRAPETPVAVIHEATTASQQTVTGSLADIGALAAGLGSPSVVVVGEVVRLREQLAWFESGHCAARGA